MQNVKLKMNVLCLVKLKIMEKLRKLMMIFLEKVMKKINSNYRSILHVDGSILEWAQNYAKF